MEKKIIKQIIANILYMNDLELIKDEGSLFTEYELSSIDFIDLCFELSQQSSIKFSPDDLWPLNKMMTIPEYYLEDNWTNEGWNKICTLLGLDISSELKGIRDLYQHFTVNYIDRYLSKAA